MWIIFFYYSTVYYWCQENEPNHGDTKKKMMTQWFFFSTRYSSTWLGNDGEKQFKRSGGTFFFIRYFYLSFNEFSCLILPYLLGSKNGHTSFQNMTFLFLLGSLNHLVIKCSKVYLRIWLYSLDKCHSKKFKTYILTGQFRFPWVFFFYLLHSA